MAQGQSTAFSRPRTFPTGGTFMETENGTLLWNRNSSLILAGCQEICAGANSVMAGPGNNPPPSQQPQREAHQKQRTPAQTAALRKAQQMAAQRRKQATTAASQKPPQQRGRPRTMAAGQGANTS